MAGQTRFDRSVQLRPGQGWCYAPSVQIQEFVDEVLRQPVFQRDGERAPNKPITVLYALGRAASGEPVIRYSEAERALIELLERFGPQRDNYKPEQAVWRLRDRQGQRTRIWHLRNADLVGIVGDGDPRIRDLREHASFGLSDEALRIFKSNRAAARYAAECIADELLPSTIQDELLDAVGLGDVDDGPESPEATAFQLSLSRRERILAERSRRSSAFSRRVLAAYAHRCAICAVAPKLDNRPFGLEAAHIRWVQAGGPDEVHNGICLCRMHHVALDRGALTVSDEHRIELSPRLRADDATKRIFAPFDGQVLHLPHSQRDLPHPDALAWHRGQVFKI